MNFIKDDTCPKTGISIRTNGPRVEELDPNRQNSSTPFTSLALVDDERFRRLSASGLRRYPQSSPRGVVGSDLKGCSLVDSIRGPSFFLFSQSSSPLFILTPSLYLLSYSSSTTTRRHQPSPHLFSPPLLIDNNSSTSSSLIFSRQPHLSRLDMKTSFLFAVAQLATAAFAFPWMAGPDAEEATMNYMMERGLLKPDSDFSKRGILDSLTGIVGSTAGTVITGVKGGVGDLVNGLSESNVFLSSFARQHV